MKRVECAGIPDPNFLQHLSSLYLASGDAHLAQRRLLMRPRCTLPLAIYATIEPRFHGQRRGIVRCDGRSPEGRILKLARRNLLDHIGGADVATPIQKSLIERAAMLELRAAMLDQKVIDGSFTDYDGKTYNAVINSLTRVYKVLGIGRPKPEFADLMKRRPGRP